MKNINTNLFSIGKGVRYLNVTPKKTVAFLYESYHFTSFTFTYKYCENDHEESKVYLSIFRDSAKPV